MFLTILDKYIIKKYLSAFFFIVLIFTLIAVVVDFSEKLDDFFNKKAPWSEIIFDYYLNFIPYINALLWPVYAVIAVIFFTSRMAYNSEFISMIGNGVNFYRLLRPYMIGAAILAGIQFLANHYIVPAGNKSRIAFENKYIWTANYTSERQNLHMFIQPGEEIFMTYYNDKDSIGQNFSYMRYEGQAIAYKINARGIKAKDGKGTWELQAYQKRSYKGLKETYQYGEKTDTIFPLKPEDLVRRDNLKETMPTPELKEFINKERMRGFAPPIVYEVERFRRTADAFTIFILTLIGVSTASRKVRGGLGLHLLIGAVISALFVFLTKFSTTFSIQGGLPAYIGVWIPNMIFLVVAIWLLRKAQK